MDKDTFNNRLLIALTECLEVYVEANKGISYDGNDFIETELRIYWNDNGKRTLITSNISRS